MKHRLFILALMLALAVASMRAQNRIDAIVERYSAIGSSTFTSVVKRNPVSRRVEEVVKTLVIGNGQVDSFKSAFEDESSSGTYACKREGRETKMMLTTENRNNRRFYMLCYQGNAAYANGDVTIIIKYLKK